MQYKLTRWLLVLISAGLLAGCMSFHPLGISDAEWQRMTPQQQMDARAKQTELDKQAAERRAERARLQALEDARLQAELEQRRANAKLGEHVQCVFNPAEAKISGNWRTVEPIALDLVVGETKPFNAEHLRDGRSRYSRQGYASFDGQTLSLCSSRSNYSSSHCVRVVSTTRGYQQGVKQKVDSKEFMRGELHCDLAQPIRMRRY